MIFMTNRVELERGKRRKPPGRRKAALIKRRTEG
jgi:hypothetical protein